MFNAAEVVGLYAETPLHPGTGSGEGVIDLPIQRERHTDIPLIQGSSLKGVFRDAADKKAKIDKGGVTKNDIWEVFGPDVGSGDDYGGALSATDARLLLFPVRSLEGIFVWVTCPFVISRLARDLDLAQVLAKVGDLPDSLQPKVGQALVGPESPLRNQIPLMLEEVDFKAENVAEVNIVAATVKKFLPQKQTYKWFESRLDTHFAIVSDSDFRTLVKTGTDIVTRIKLNIRKTTTGGGGNMWVEEFLPSDCLFYSLLLAMPSRKDGGNKLFEQGAGVLDFVKTATTSRLIQIGGDETVGRGWMRIEFVARSEQDGTK